MGMVLWSLPGFDGLIGLSALIGLAGCAAGLGWVLAQVKGAAERRRLSKVSP